VTERPEQQTESMAAGNTIPDFLYLLRHMIGRLISQLSNPETVTSHAINTCRVPQQF